MTAGRRRLAGDADQSPAAALLEADRLTRSYRRRGAFGRRAGASEVALRDVSVRLEAGGRLGIVGESGAGKSTLVRLLLGLDAPDAGEVRVDGRVVDAAARPRAQRWLRQRVQVVLQDPYSSLDPRMTVAKAIAEPLECLGVEEDHRARVDELLDDVRLGTGVRDRYPHELSGGQRQRVAIARALAPRPALLVGDEPLSALDVSIRADLLELLERLVAERGLALVLVSHDLAVVGRLCEHVLVLRGGVLVEEGPVQRVLHQPEQPYTRALLDAIPTL